MRSKTDLRDTQHDIADAVYGNDQHMIVADMGSGKTAATLTAIDELLDDGVRHGALVIAPPLVAADVWPEEVQKWEHLAHLNVVHLAGGPAARLELLQMRGVDIFTMSCHLCQWLADMRGSLPKHIDMLVIDESSFFKDPRSKNGKALRSIASRFGSRIELTGTPRPNGYEDLWGQMQILTADTLFEPFDKWRRKNFMPLDPGGLRWEVHDFRAAQIDKLTAPLVTEVPVALDLPAFNSGRDFDIRVDLPAAARKHYRQMEKQLIIDVAAELPPGADDDTIIAALSAGVANGKLRQIANGHVYKDGDAYARLHGAKIEALKEFKLQTAGENVLIWYSFKEDIAMIREVYGEKTPVLSGLTLPQKQKVVQQFADGDLPALIAHPASAAHGIDKLKDGGRRMLWFSPTFSNEGYQQAVKRLHRPGQTQPVFSHRIVAKDTVDELAILRVDWRQQDQVEWAQRMNDLAQEVRKELQ